MSGPWSRFQLLFGCPVKTPIWAMLSNALCIQITCLPGVVYPNVPRKCCQEAQQKWLEEQAAAQREEAARQEETTHSSGVWTGLAGGRLARHRKVEPAKVPDCELRLILYLSPPFRLSCRSRRLREVTMRAAVSSCTQRCPLHLSRR